MEPSTRKQLSSVSSNVSPPVPSSSSSFTSQMQRIAVDLEPIPPMDFYRSTAVGQALTMALNDLLMKNEIPSVEAFEIRSTFDTMFEPKLRDHLVMKKDMIYHEAEGKLANYSSIEDMWRVDTGKCKVRIGDEVREYKRARLLFAKDNTSSSNK